MLALGGLSIKAKLYGLVVFGAIGLSALLGLRSGYRVNGPVYDHLSRPAAALAEVEPATFYVGHPYLLMQEMAATTDPAHLGCGRYPEMHG